MRKFLFSLCLGLLCFAQVGVSADSLVTKVYDNYTLLTEVSDLPEITHPLYAYEVDLPSGVRVNVYDLFASKTMFQQDDCTFGCSVKEDATSISVYHTTGGTSQRLRTMNIQDGSTEYCMISGYRLWIRGEKKNDTLSIRMDLQEIGEASFVYDQTTQFVTISGKTIDGQSDQVIAMTLIPKAVPVGEMRLTDILYLAQCMPNEEGEWSVRFPYAGDITSCKAVLNINGAYVELADAECVATAYAYDAAQHKAFLGGKTTAWMSVSVSWIPKKTGLSSYENIRATVDQNGYWRAECLLYENVADYKAVVYIDGNQTTYDRPTYFDSEQVSDLRLTLKRADNTVSACLTVSNAFEGENEQCMTILGFYDESGQLIYATGGENYAETVTAEIPNTAVLVRAYAWKSIHDPTPYTCKQEMKLRENTE